MVTYKDRTYYSKYEIIDLLKSKEKTTYLDSKLIDFVKKNNKVAYISLKKDNIIREVQLHYLEYCYKKLLYASFAVEEYRQIKN